MTRSTKPAEPVQACAGADCPASVPITGALASLSLTMLLPALGTSSANVALPAIANALAAPFQNVQWVVLAYLLAITTLSVSVGRLGDLAGRRRLLLAGIVLFGVASLACARAPSLWLLVAARALQGMGAAVMMTLTVAFVGALAPKSRTGSIMGLLGTMSAIGTTLGPALGGMLLARFGWPAIFLVNAPLALVALRMTWRHLPPDARAPVAQRGIGHPGFDHPGTLALAFTLGAYALAMTLGRGHFGLRNGALLLAAAGGALLFVRIERAARAPLVRLAMLRAPSLGAGLAANTLVSTVMMATLVVGPFYLNRGLGLDPAATGAVLAAGPLMAAFCGIPSGRLVDRYGAVRMGTLGLAGAVAACALLALLPSPLGIPAYAAPLMLLTASYALFQAANNTAIMADIAPDQRGVVSGLLNLSRNLGLITGASVMGAVFVAAAGVADVARAHPADVVRGMHLTFGLAAVLVAAALALAGATRLQRRAPASTGDAA